MKKHTLLILLAILSFSISFSCDSGGDSSNTQPPEPGLENQFILAETFTNLTFDNPLDIQNAGDGTNRLFVVEQRGVIHVISNLGTNNSRELQMNEVLGNSSIFLDIQDRVEFNQGELGLLGLAFHPDYENNGLFYVNYTAENPLRTVISEFQVDTQNPDLANEGSEVILLEVEQPTTLHNGGQLVFGPEDGYLYISLGDGGPPFGRNGTSQDSSNLLGTISRIDVDSSEGELNYGIPEDNPFANNNEGFREEIFATGFRNPWRIAFDEVRGTLWTGDVGEFSREELNIVENGKNYGWPITEGTLCFNPSSGCDFSGIELPELEYGRGQGGSVIGGIVYYGTQFPELSGLYIYADFVSGRLWALEHNGTTVVNNTQLLQFNPFSIVAFGIDERGELYIASFDGNIYQLERIQNF